MLRPVVVVVAVVVYVVAVLLTVWGLGSKRPTDALKYQGS